LVVVVAVALGMVEMAAQAVEEAQATRIILVELVFQEKVLEAVVL
jgi:hypothetical protein